MKFSKAKPGQGFYKESKYGPPGSGKTFTTLLMAEGLAKRDGKRIAYVDTERGTDFYAKAVPEREVHPGAFDFDAIYTRSLAETIEAVQSLNPDEHGVIVLDSMSHLWDAAIGAYEGKMNKADAIPMHAWGKIKKPYKGLVRWLMDAPFHVFILGRQKNVFETNPDDGQMTKVGVGMRAEAETEFEPHLCARMELKKDETDPRKFNVCAVYEKDRTGILSGKTFINPSFKTIEPIMSLLNGYQAQSEDPDEVTARDSELLDKEETKRKEKGERSADFLAEFTAKIQASKILDELATVASEIKKQKRYLLPSHTDSLGILYKRHRDVLTDQQAPAEV